MKGTGKKKNTEKAVKTALAIIISFLGLLIGLRANVAAFSQSRTFYIDLAKLYDVVTTPK